MESRTEHLTYQADLVDATAWIAPTATLTAHVEVGADSSVWFGAVLRGDSDKIRIGEATNVQDLCCLHADPGFPCLIGNRVTIGHAAVVHGASLEDECLIGIGATVLTGAKIGKHSIVAAGAVVLEGQQVPPCSVVAGVPARIIRETSREDVARILRGGEHYVRASREYQALAK